MNYKNECKNSISNDLNQKDHSSLSEDASKETIDVQALIYEIRNLCEESTSAFFKDDYMITKKSLTKLFILMNKNMNFIQYMQIESPILSVFETLNFDCFIFKICEIIMNSKGFEEMIVVIVNCIYFLTCLSKSYFKNHNLIPFLNTIYNNHVNSNIIQKEIVEIYARILPNQIIYDPNFSNFAPFFFQLLESLHNYDLKANLVESFLNSSSEMKIYFQSLLPFLNFFLEKGRCTDIEIRIITALIKQENEIFPLLIQNGFIHHIFNSISKFKEDINIQIIKFYLFILNFDMTIRKSVNFDDVCLDFFNSESEEEQMCALDYFWHFLPECMQLLFDNIGIDLIWSIISDGFLHDSNIELKVVSMRFLHKLLHFNSNNEMTTCILQSNICEICEIMLNLGDFESNCLCIDVLNIFLDIVVKQPKYCRSFISQFKQSDIESILMDLTDENLQIRAFDLLAKIGQLGQKV